MSLMPNEINPATGQIQPSQIIIKKGSSGCLPFGCGCLSGIFLTFFLFAGFICFGLYATSQYLQTVAISYYQSDLRPQIVSSEIPAQQKQMILKDLDQLAVDFPRMTFPEKAKAIQSITEKYEEQFKSLQKEMGAP